VREWIKNHKVVSVIIVAAIVVVLLLGIDFGITHMGGDIGEGEEIVPCLEVEE